MTFLRTTGYPPPPFYHKRIKVILEGSKVEPVDEKLRRYKSNWLRHVTRMDSNRMIKIMLNCRTNGRRRLRRPFKRRLDEAETGLSRPNWWRMMTNVLSAPIYVVSKRWHPEAKEGAYLFYFILFYFILFYFILFYFILFYFILFSWIRAS
jgi:hypothetical protein